MESIIECLAHLTEKELIYLSRQMNETCKYKSERMKTLQELIQIMRKHEDKKQEESYRSEMDFVLFQLKKSILLLVGYKLALYFRNIMTTDDETYLDLTVV